MAQAKVITEPETFKPITLQITLETQGEVNALFSLCSRVSETLYDVSKNAKELKNHTYENIEDVTSVIYNELNLHSR